jgi:hypothetical protein
MSGGNIKVVCRFRPQNRVENENNGRIVIEFQDEQNVSIEVPTPFLLPSYSLSLPPPHGIQQPLVKAQSSCHPFE